MSNDIDICKILANTTNPKKALKYARIVMMLEKMKLSYTSHNNGLHLIVDVFGSRADIWPTTGRYRIGAESGTGEDKLKDILIRIMGLAGVKYAQKKGRVKIKRRPKRKQWKSKVEQQSKEQAE